MRGLKFLAGFACMALLFGCASPPPPPPPTVVNVTLVTTADTNPTVDNVGAPIAIRVYQLASPTNFNGAEFFALYNGDAALLKSDLIRREDSLLAPGATKSQTINPTDQVKSIGVLAAYREPSKVVWRVAADVEANKTTNITVTAGHNGLVIKTEVVAAKPAK
jgi:type VI secretion system protein VasD